MDSEQLLKMDANMLLSIVNMKLRNEFPSLQAFCDDVNIESDIIVSRLQAIGYLYDKELNQFVWSK